MSNQQRNQAFKQIHVSTVTTLPCHPRRDARPERSCSQIYKMGTGLYQRTETISIGFAKIAANRRVTGRRPAQLAVLDDADAAAPCDHPPDRRQHERHAAVCADPVQRLAAEAAISACHISTDPTSPILVPAGFCFAYFPDKTKSHGKSYDLPWLLLAE